MLSTAPCMQYALFFSMPVCKTIGIHKQILCSLCSGFEKKLVHILFRDMPVYLTQVVFLFFWVNQDLHLSQANTTGN